MPAGVSPEEGGGEKLSRRHAVKLSPDAQVSVEECSLAVGEKVGYKSVKFAARMNRAVVVFLDSIDKVNSVVESGVAIRDVYTQVMPRFNSARRVMISNAPPVQVPTSKAAAAVTAAGPPVAAAVAAAGPPVAAAVAAAGPPVAAAVPGAGPPVPAAVAPVVTAGPPVAAAGPPVAAAVPPVAAVEPPVAAAVPAGGPPVAAAGPLVDIAVAPAVVAVLPAGASGRPLWATVTVFGGVVGVPPAVAGAGAPPAGALDAVEWPLAVPALGRYEVAQEMVEEREVGMVIGDESSKPSENGTTVYEHDEIRRYAAAFYKGLYASEVVSHTESAQPFFEGLPQVQANKVLEEVLSMEELKEALQSLKAFGFSPGFIAMIQVLYRDIESM
ncbi:hypothetical protein NHX12_000155, partial [Muraenolepis orangiensis]